MMPLDVNVAAQLGKATRRTPLSVQAPTFRSPAPLEMAPIVPKALSVENTRLPAPSLVSGLVPDSARPMVAVWLLTVMAGEPALTASVSEPELPGLRNQLWLAPRSPKTRLPIVWALSSVTVVSAVRLRVLKSAVAAAPLAMVPPLQLAALVQLPPSSLIQVPLAALAPSAPPQQTRAHRQDNARFMLKLISLGRNQFDRLDHGFVS